MRLMQILSFRKKQSWAETEVFEPDTILLDDGDASLDLALMTFEPRDTVPAPLPVA